MCEETRQQIMAPERQESKKTRKVYGNAACEMCRMCACDNVRNRPKCDRIIAVMISWPICRDRAIQIVAMLYSSAKLSVEDYAARQYETRSLQCIAKYKRTNYIFL